MIVGGGGSPVACVDGGSIVGGGTGAMPRGKGRAGVRDRGGSIAGGGRSTVPGVEGGSTMIGRRGSAKGAGAASGVCGGGGDAVVGVGADARVGVGTDAVVDDGADAVVDGGADALEGGGAEAHEDCGADALGDGGAGLAFFSEDVRRMRFSVSSARVWRGAIRPMTFLCSECFIRTIDELVAGGCGMDGIEVSTTV